MAGVTSLVRAALPAVPVANRLPGVRKDPVDAFEPMSLTGPEVAVEAEHVAAYAEVCGFPRKDTVPLTYPHLLSFDLQMQLMASPRFPWPAIGTVHVENSITSHRPIAVGEVLGPTVSVGAPRGHAKGTLLDFSTTISSGEEIVWESVSTYLRRGASHGPTSGGLDLPSAPTGTTTWRLPADLGRRYAAVSGDLNPIHLWPLTARALGFRRQIAHGMWTKARCVAAIENRLPESVRVDVGFRRPVFLPGRVAFGLSGDRAEATFGLSSPDDSSTHLVGRAARL